MRHNFERIPSDSEIIPRLVSAGRMKTLPSDEVCLEDGTAKLVLVVRPERILDVTFYQIGQWNTVDKAKTTIERLCKRWGYSVTFAEEARKEPTQVSSSK